MKGKLWRFIKSLFGVLAVGGVVVSSLLLPEAIAIRQDQSLFEQTKTDTVTVTAYQSSRFKLENGIQLFAAAMDGEGQAKIEDGELISASPLPDCITSFRTEYSGENDIWTMFGQIGTKPTCREQLVSGTLQGIDFSRTILRYEWQIDELADFPSIVRAYVDQDSQILLRFEFLSPMISDFTNQLDYLLQEKFLTGEEEAIAELGISDAKTTKKPAATSEDEAYTADWDRYTLIFDLLNSYFGNTMIYYYAENATFYQLLLRQLETPKLDGYNACDANSGHIDYMEYEGETWKALSRFEGAAFILLLTPNK